MNCDSNFLFLQRYEKKLKLEQSKKQSYNIKKLSHTDRKKSYICK